MIERAVLVIILALSLILLARIVWRGVARARGTGTGDPCEGCPLSDECWRQRAAGNGDDDGDDDGAA
jgi:hypothetical protein